MQPRARAISIVVCLACGFTAVSYNLIQIQLVQHDKYRQIAILEQLRPETILPNRGSIYDNDGNLLAETQQRTELHVDGKLLEHPTAQLSLLAQILQIPAQQLVDGFDSRKRDIHLADNLDDTVVTKLKALKWNSLIFKPHDRRFYPNNELGSHILGILGSDGHGLMGIEKEMDSSLSGVPGERWVERDGKGKDVAAYQTGEKPEVDGNNVRLTISMPIQHVIEEQLDQIVKTYQPDAAYIIVMDPHTGEVLAMGSRPTFDPNNSGTYQADNLRNRCLTDPVEPGSIFKIIAMAAAFNEGLINLNTPIFCDNGEFHYAGYTLKDDGEKHGWLSAMEVMSQSSNIGFAHIGLDYLHEAKLYKYATAFGIGQRTGLFSQQGESPGLLRPVSKWSALSITRIPFGQEVSATPIQMATAMCVIANGGRLVAPQLIQKVTDQSGRVLQIYPPRTVRQVISTDAAREVTRALEQVAIDGTAKNIHIQDLTGAGWSMAVKTGTAQKLVNGEYSHTEHVSSFLGFVPAEDPAFVTLVMVDDPHTLKNQDYGAEVSGPVFANVARQVAQILNVQPDIPAPQRAPILTSNTPSTL